MSRTWMPTATHSAGETTSLTILAQGPYNRAASGGPLTAVVKVPAERIVPGPRGARLDILVRNVDGKIVPLDLGSGAADSDPRARGWGPVDGPPAPDMDSMLRDRRFLAQNVYAVAMSTLSEFERSLGRRMGWRNDRRLKILAYDTVDYRDTGYSRQDYTVRFGRRRDGRNRASVPLALFRDLVVHEVTHAVLDGYRRRWTDGHATLDQFALHEAVADIVAMLTVFSSHEVVEQLLREQLRSAGTDDPSRLDAALLRCGLFDFADHLYTHGAPARSTLGQPPPPGWRDAVEPHRRAAGAVYAVLSTVLRLWRRRMETPDRRASVHQVAEAGAVVGTHVLRMVIRGLGYMAPVDVGWEDFLRGILAADQVLVPEDTNDYRGALRCAFAEVGVHAGPDSGLDGTAGLRRLNYPIRLSALGSDPEEVLKFIWDNPSLMEAAALDPDRSISVDRVRPSERISPDGFVVHEYGASFAQEFVITRAQARARGLPAQGPVVVRGGGLLRFDEGGRLCFAALKRVNDHVRQSAKLEQLRQEGLPERSILAETFHPGGWRPDPPGTPGRVHPTS